MACFETGESDEADEEAEEEEEEEEEELEELEELEEEERSNRSTRNGMLQPPTRSRAKKPFARVRSEPMHYESTPRLARQHAGKVELTRSEAMRAKLLAGR